jgi:hypothetical protein
MGHHVGSASEGLGDSGYLPEWRFMFGEDSGCLQGAVLLPSAAQKKSFARRLMR